MGRYVFLCLCVRACICMHAPFPQLLPSNACSCLTRSCDCPTQSCDCPAQSCDCDRDLVATILLPSLTSALRSLATPTNHTPTCSGRIHHSSTYDPRSDSILVFGGVDLSGNICSAPLVQINSTPLTSVGGVADFEGVWLGETGSGSGSSDDPPLVVRLVGGGSGPVPSGRYHHTATLIEVRCKRMFVCLLTCKCVRV